MHTHTMHLEVQQKLTGSSLMKTVLSFRILRTHMTMIMMAMMMMAITIKPAMTAGTMISKRPLPDGLEAVDKKQHKTFIVCVVNNKGKSLTLLLYHLHH